MAEFKFTNKIGKNSVDPQTVMNDYIELLEMGIKELKQNHLLSQQKPEVLDLLWLKITKIYQIVIQTFTYVTKLYKTIAVT